MPGEHRLDRRAGCTDGNHEQTYARWPSVLLLRAGRATVRLRQPHPAAAL